MTSLGTISDVTIDHDTNKIFVDVVVSPTQFEPQVRFRTPGVGAWFVPSEGDVVEVKRIGKNRAVAYAPYNTAEKAFPENLSEGDIAFRLDENTLCHFEKSGDTYDITLKTDGKIHLDSETVVVGENEDGVATQ